MDVDVVVFFIFGNMWWLLLREDCKLICVNIKCVFGKDLIRKSVWILNLIEIFVLLFNIFGLI